VALLQHRFGPQGLYILDEPEAALSPARQLSLLVRIHALVGQGCQFIIATHAPIVLAYPDALIYELDVDGSPPAPQTYDKTQTVRTTADFLRDRQRWLSRILVDEA
jgi:predicted ATPase